MAKNEKAGQLLVLLGGFVLGVIVAIIATHPPNTGTFYSRSVIVLYDPNCDICTPELNRVVQFMENNLPSAKNVTFIWQDVRSGAGARKYVELVEERNVNLVPLVLFTKDLEDTDFFKELNEAFAASGGIGANLIDVGKYYALRPRWPTRRYVPGKPEVRVTVLASRGVDVNNIKSLLYLSADNVVVDVKETNDTVLRIEATPEIIAAIAPYFPLARVAGGVLEVPKIVVTVFARPDFAEPVENVLKNAGIEANVQTTLYGTYVLANIVTDYPDLVGKLFPGAKYYQNGISITRDETLNIDLFLAGDENEWIDELNRIVSLTRTDGGYRGFVVPHYAAGLQGGNVIFPGGQDAFNRAVAEYCAYLNAPAKWTEFVSSFRACGGTADCIESVSKQLSIDADRITNCAQTSSNQILQFFINDTAQNRVTKTSALINGWLYVDEPDRLKDYVCAMLSFPPEELCGGEVQ
ncbi:MAG: hypothetical protein PWQ11_464 [Candidatus Diapherotrites archaeon]|nr:hypothetical protein [Candidatus Diapherotrites archaeon]